MSSTAAKIGAFAINPVAGLISAGSDIVGGLKKALNPEAPAAPGFAPPPSPDSSDPETARRTQEQEANAAAAERKARGRASTILTGAGGAAPGGSIARRTLLGA